MKIVITEQNAISIDKITDDMIIVMEYSDKYYILACIDPCDYRFAPLSTGCHYYKNISKIGISKNKYSAVKEEMKSNDKIFHAFKTDEDFAEWCYNALKKDTMK